MAHGYDPKKILGWVARSDKNSPPAPAARQSPSVVPAVTAPAGSVAAVQADEADKAPIAEAVIPQRLEPSLPQQPRTTKAAVIEPRQQPSTSGQQPSTTEQPPRQQRTPEQPVERPSIAIIEGGPAVQIRDSVGRAEPQVGDSGPPLARRRRPSAQAPSSRASSSPALVLAAGPRGHFDEPHTRAAEAHHEPPPDPLVTEFTHGGRTTRSEGSF